MFTCKHCNRHYGAQRTLNTHVRKLHPDVPRDDIRKKFQCSGDGCQKSYNNKQSLSRHERFIHNIHTIPKNTSIYKCPLCGYEFIKRESTLNHLERDHLLEIKPLSMSFDSEEEFVEWRQNTENSTHAKFIAKGGKHKNRLTKSQTLICHRANKTHHPKSERKRRMKTKGSCKLNLFCPAYIKYREENGIFSVHYVGIHTHEQELEHLRLSDSERCMLARKIAEGESFTKILDDIRESFYNGNQLKRIHLTTRNDLLNIEQCFGLKEKDASDANSIEICIKEESESNSPPSVLCSELGSEYTYREWGENLEEVEGHEPVIVSELTKEEIVLDLENEKNDLMSLCSTIINDATNEPEHLALIKKKLYETSKNLKMMKEREEKSLRNENAEEQNFYDEEKLDISLPLLL